METDRTELHDLAGRGGRLEADLLRCFEDWAQRSGVMDWHVLLPRLLAAWDMDNAEG